jgi:hypothetical protein
MTGLYTEESLLQIVLVSGLIGGGAAWLAGRAIAQTWRPFGHVIGYMGLLGGAVRFAHYALFEATLLSPLSYAADTAFLLLMGLLSWRITHIGQTVKQYDWLYERAGLLSLRARAPRGPDGGGTMKSRD